MTTYCWMIIPRYNSRRGDDRNAFACVATDRDTAIRLAPAGIADDPDLLNIRVVKSNHNGEVWSEEFLPAADFKSAAVG